MSWQLVARRPLPGGSEQGGTWIVEWTSTSVMGIVNVTPDSFSDGGRHLHVDDAVAWGRRMFADGALVVDVGGESTRPGADPVDVETELERVVPVVGSLVSDGAGLVSIDTRSSTVAEAAIDAGAHLVNDVGGLGDPAMLELCARTGTPAVIVHMQGTPTTMQLDPTYDDVVSEVASFLRRRAGAALAAGVPSVLVDPGIGFGKTVAHNLELLGALPLVDDLPVLVGASRKGFIGSITGVEQADHRDPGSLAVHLHAAQHAVAMVRAHDVAGHVQALGVSARLRPGGH